MAFVGRFADKIAIVTAATKGIGFAIADRLGSEGAKVVISSRKQSNVDEALSALRSKGITAEGIVCHVAKASDRQNIIKLAHEKFGGIDIFISNAGINPHFGSLLDISEDVWDKMFEVNVKSSFLFCKQLVPEIAKRGGGSIVFVSSIAGYVPPNGIMGYGVTKTALLGLTKALAMTCGDMKIRVNCIAPGIINTDFSKALLDAADPLEPGGAFPPIPLGRVGRAEDCAGTVAFLCSQDASYITGETITITGGMHSRL